jgi:hypothetical protein
MTSWRDTTSEQAQADLDQLLDEVLPLAEQTLGKAGELAPFGAGIADDGDVSLITVDVSGKPEVRDAALGDLLAAARSIADDHRAFAFVAEVVAEEGHQVQVELEHREGTAIRIVADYDRSRLRRQVTRTGMKAKAARPVVWSA